MYQSESMIQMLEDMQYQANEMEKSIKDMLEVEGRAIGIELDKRKNARDLFNELSEKQNEIAEEQAQEQPGEEDEGSRRRVRAERIIAQRDEVRQEGAEGAERACDLAEAQHPPAGEDAPHASDQGVLGIFGAAAEQRLRIVLGLGGW